MKEGAGVAWKDDLSASMDVFNRLVWPCLKEMCHGGDYIPVEGSPDEIAQILDKQIGIDGMLKKGSGFYGVGSRIQIDSGVWNTFTIRCERESGHITELEKLRRAINNDSLRPQLTLQAYVERDALKSLAVAKTVDIVRYIDAQKCDERMSHDKKGFARFVVVPWDKFKQAGYGIIMRDFR